jgi:hypothetical protein
MNYWKFFYPWLLIPLCVFCYQGAMAQGCTRCHVAEIKGFTGTHSLFAQACALCHAGKAEASTESEAHRGLIAFPGNMDSAQKICGGCHRDKVGSVQQSLMHSGAGLVATTREGFDEPTDRPGHNDMAHLTHSPADSLLRKQCASCHLGQQKRAHRLNPTFDRGGGCLACHINTQSLLAHPDLSARVSDARCFGCHSRSGRVSLNFAGLAETDTVAATNQQLEDGRSVEVLPADIHHKAGMGCIDCHTENDVMAVGADHSVKRAKQAVDIACVDCHDITRTITRAQWPSRYRNLLKRISFSHDADTPFPVTAKGTPLWNVELRGTKARLHRKDGRGVLVIPAYQASKHPLAKQHARLNCSACHSQWAPQCYGCHMDYDAGLNQFDHMEQKNTAGRWISLRSDVRNTLPPLGVNSANRIVPVLPGMIMTATHPLWPKTLFKRRFQSIEPHTTGAARSCASCHRESTALGLGKGTLRRLPTGKLDFHGTQPLLEDGLPADAWTSLESAEIENKMLRPFSKQEMEHIFSVPLGHAEVQKHRSER